jgi:D-threo-aldose 1-dehydrogenase
LFVARTNWDCYFGLTDGQQRRPGEANTSLEGIRMGIREYLLNSPLGFGAAPLGNMFRNIPDAEADATVEAASTAGTRYFDTAPFYGAGLSEIRLGKVLSKHTRSDYLLSSKVGRLILNEVEQDVQTFGEKERSFQARPKEQSRL